MTRFQELGMQYIGNLFYLAKNFNSSILNLVYSPQMTSGQTPPVFSMITIFLSLFQASLSQPFVAWPVVEVWNVSPAWFTRKPVESWRYSLRTSSVTPLPTLNMPRGRPSPPWTSSTHSRGKAVLSTVSEDKPAFMKATITSVKYYVNANNSVFLFLLTKNKSL